MHPSIALLTCAMVAADGVRAAVTSLFIPGFDTQSLSVDVVGVEGDKTTYALQKGVYTNAEDDESGFVGTATLVEGPDYASLTYEYNQDDLSLTIGYDCSLNGEIALCSGVQDGITYTLTETASPFEVAVGTTAAGAAGSGSTPTATKASDVAQVSQTGSSSRTSSAAESTSTGDGAGSLSVSSTTTFGAVAAIVLGLLAL
ncbi:hypothetical protein CYLTODRAFT_419184 [Cylindrobasidium torrendii FP15055 ss-10]|uniref:Uncharacterized protein n=1 Tax=Cylindrobasidium torrendii FP15055 ss-10 TaxID=1314674 RepID=A0A0D7BKG2_9AGAR|nr:hypothetical protein CYLTODRAFT_419184 [Cylindrobasidium torrendii FP15055 ss-10]